MLGALAEDLDRAREAEVAAVAAALAQQQLVGITGPAETGKSTLVGHALARLEVNDQVAVVRVDLDGVYSPRHLARRWLRAVARAAAGPTAFSHIVGLSRAAWPGTTRSADHRVRTVLGSDYGMALDEGAGAPRSKGGDEDVARALDATERLVATRPARLIVDHLEAPELSRALDVRKLLWQVRALSQREPALRVTLVCRRGAVNLAAGSDAAFFGDGTWLTIDNPQPEVWRRALGDAEVAEAALARTGGHVHSTLLVAHRAEQAGGVEQAFATLAVEHSPLAARAVQHAASLHRLGPVLLRAIANDQRPYGAIPDAPSRDVAAAAQRLELAGLTHRVQRGQWRVVNPLVARALCEPQLDPDFGTPEGE